MEISLSTANSYWSILKFLSSDIKLELIAKLTNSLIKHNKSVDNIDASQFYGLWKDSDFPMDADTMVKEIKSSRTFKNDIEAF